MSEIYTDMGPPRSAISDLGDYVPSRHRSTKGSYLILTILGIIILIASVVILILAALRKWPTVTLGGTAVQTTGSNNSTTNIDWPLILVCLLIGMPTGIAVLVLAQQTKF